jgi:hypothetical protein
MWKWGLRPHSSFSGNIYLEFSILCLCSVVYLVVLLILRIRIDRQPPPLLTQQQRVGGVPIQHVDTPTCPLDQQHHDAQKQPFINACKACRHGGTHGTWLGHDLCMAKGHGHLCAWHVLFFTEAH